jgi:hypothetical protein
VCICERRFAINGLCFWGRSAHEAEFNMDSESQQTYAPCILNQNLSIKWKLHKYAPWSHQEASKYILVSDTNWSKNQQTGSLYSFSDVHQLSGTGFEKKKIIDLSKNLAFMFPEYTFVHNIFEISYSFIFQPCQWLLFSQSTCHFIWIFWVLCSPHFFLLSVCFQPLSTLIAIFQASF